MKRMIGDRFVEPIGLGCMPLSHAYGAPPTRERAMAVLRRALDLGYDHLDTAALYGFGANEELLGEVLTGRREQVLLASKCGMMGVGGKRVIDGRPDVLRRTLDEALTRLRTDRIDLYYLHRLDKKVPIEESVGAMGEFVEAGKVRWLGLSEVSAATLLKANAVHPIAAVQNEYSPWSRNVELGILDATKRIGAALVCFSPIARGFLAGRIASPDELTEGDIRRAMPRFQGDNLARNRLLLEQFADIAKTLGISPAQLSLAWVLSHDGHIVAIPGTTSLEHIEENFAARRITLDPAVRSEIDRLFAPGDIAGARYAAVTQGEIDTEEFD